MAGEETRKRERWSKYSAIANGFSRKWLGGWELTRFVSWKNQFLE
jgi:hypothetical protein